MTPDLFTNNRQVSKLNRCIAHQLTARCLNHAIRPSWALTRVPANENFLPGPPWPLGAA